MPATFEKKFQQSIKKRGEYSAAGLWLNTIIIGGLFVILGSAYQVFRDGVFGLFAVNRALAFAGFILSGSSMALSGIGYFWDFADTKLIYRKHLGWIGFLLITLHVILSVFFLSDQFRFPGFYHAQLMPFLFGSASFIIFILLAAVSNRYAAYELGGVRWRQVLRLTYLAYILAIVHLVVRSAPSWLVWIRSGESFLPPLSLITFLSSIPVFWLRIALWWALRWNKRVVPAVTSSSRQTSSAKQRSQFA